MRGMKVAYRHLILIKSPVGNTSLLSFVFSDKAHTYDIVTPVLLAAAITGSLRCT